MANAKQRRKKNRASTSLRAASSPPLSPATANSPVVVPVVPMPSIAPSKTPTVESWPKIIGYTVFAFVTFVGSVATAYQVAGVQNVPFAHLILVLGWLGFVGSFFLLERVLLLPRRQMLKLTIAVAFVSGLVMLGMDLLMVYLKASQTDESAILHPAPNIKPDIVSQTPYILTRLVIDSVSENDVVFHLQIDNGESPIKEIRVSYSTSNFNVDPEVVGHGLFESSTFMPRMLPPHGTLSIPGRRQFLTRDKRTDLTVMIGYRAETSTTTSKDFTVVYRFLVRPEDIKPQIIHPQGVETKEQEFNDKALQSRFAVQAFRLNSGTFSFDAQETRRNGEPNIVTDKNEFRSFEFNPVTRLVTFQMNTSSGKSISLQLPLPQREDRRHRVWFSWHYSEGGYLIVDGTGTRNIKGKTSTFSMPPTTPN